MSTTDQTNQHSSSLSITLKSHESESIENAIQEILRNFQGATTILPKIVRFPTKRQLYTVIRSPHVHKKSRDQFQRQTFKASIIFSSLTESGFIGRLKHLKLRGIQISWTIHDSTTYPQAGSISMS